jgi:hypothetical protein
VKRVSLAAMIKCAAPNRLRWWCVWCCGVVRHDSLKDSLVKRYGVDVQELIKVNDGVDRAVVMMRTRIIMIHDKRYISCTTSAPSP